MLPTLARLERGNLSLIKYLNIGARATRTALTDDARAKAERLSGTVSGLRYQEWKDGQGGEQKWVNESAEEKA